MGASFKDKHVLITGGSEGIGLSLASCFLQDGAVVTLLSRSREKLSKAKDELQSKYTESTINTVAADVSQAETLSASLKKTDRDLPVDAAICVAGFCIPRLFKDQPLEEARMQMEVNYWGCYNTARALLPSFLERKVGHICFISSMAYVAPMAGFTGYSPSKAAVRHLADCMRNELLGTGVTVSVGYPPDTLTPGYEKENTTKPGETKAISQALQDTEYASEKVAKCLFSGLKKGMYHLPTPDFGHQVGLSLVAGLTPRPKWAIIEILLAPILVIVSIILGRKQDEVVRQYHKSHPY